MIYSIFEHVRHTIRVRTFKIPWHGDSQSIYVFFFELLIFRARTLDNVWQTHELKWGSKYCVRYSRVTCLETLIEPGKLPKKMHFLRIYNITGYFTFSIQTILTIFKQNPRFSNYNIQKYCIHWQISDCTKKGKISAPLYTYRVHSSFCFNLVYWDNKTRLSLDKHIHPDNWVGE